MSRQVACRLCVKFCLGFLVSALFLSPTHLSAQAPDARPAIRQPPAPPPPTPQQVLKPAEAYKEAFHPVDVVRKSLENWSDAELAALSEATRRASDLCGQSRLADYSGDDLYDLQRLCSLGQNWVETNAAATKYIESGEGKHRAHSYAMSLDCLVHLNRIPQAVETAKKMLHELPYDAVVAQSIWYLVIGLQSNFNPQALDLAKQQHPLLTEALRKGEPLKDPNGDGVISPGNLYEEGMLLAFLERYANDEEGAARTTQELKNAISQLVSIEPDDQQLVRNVDTQYSLLGKPLPNIDLTGSFLQNQSKPRLNHGEGLTTAMVIFPEWCAQCLKMMTPALQFAIRNGNEHICAYGLMVANQIPGAPEPQKEDRLKNLRGTPTILTPAQTLATFGAVEFPLGVISDRKGIVRFIGQVPTNAFDPGGYMEQTIERFEAHPTTATK